MPSNHLILCHLLLLLPLIFPSIMVFSKDSALHIRWPKYWSFSFSTSPSNEYSGLISFRIDWFDFLAIQGTLKSLLQHQSRWILYCWDTREALSTLKALSSMLAYLYLQFSTPFRDSLLAQLVKNLPSMRRPWFDSWVGKIHGRRNGHPLKKVAESVTGETVIERLQQRCQVQGPKTGACEEWQDGQCGWTMLTFLKFPWVSVCICLSL